MPVSHEPEEKPDREPRTAQAGNKEKELIRKACKLCGEEFDTYNSKKETCSDKCRAAFFRKNRT